MRALADSAYEPGSEAGQLHREKALLGEKKNNYFVGPVILQLCHSRRKTNITRVFFRLMALEKMSNRSQKVVLDASNDSFEVGSCKKNRDRLFAEI